MLISILIPTRNRERELKILLDSIGECCRNLYEAHSFPFEVIICDDGVDETEEMVKKWSKLNFNIPTRYQKLNDPWDVDYKLKLMVKRAKGMYSWFLGSDDEVIPEAFRNFCEFILTKPIRKIVQVNFQDYDKDIVTPLGQEVIFPWVYKDFSSAEDFLHESKGRYGFMGATLYNTQLLKQYMYATPDIYGYYFMATLLVLLKYPSQHATIYSTVILKRRMANTCWGNSGGDYIRNLINRVRLIDVMEQFKYGKFTVDKWRWDNYLQLYESILAGRYRGLRKEDNVYNTIKRKYDGRIVRMISWLLLNIPIPQKLLKLLKYLNNQFS